MAKLKFPEQESESEVIENPPSVGSYHSSINSRHESGKGSEGSSVEESIWDPDRRFRSMPCCWKDLFRRLHHIEAYNLKFNPIDPGNWDDWGVYYCSSRFGRHTLFNPTYFSLVGIIIIGQSNFFRLIFLMQEHGGFVFLLVLLMTYIFFAYPAYVLETLMGQYSGRKPLQMIKLLLPVFSGLGTALYIRTFYRAVAALGNFAHCLYHSWDLLFCKAAESVHLKRIVHRDRDYKTFKLFSGLEHPIFTFDPDDGDFDQIKWAMFAVALSITICFKKLNEFGAGMKVVLRLLLLLLFGYTVNGYLRVKAGDDPHYTTRLSSDTIIYLPLKMTFSPKWIKLLDGGSWVEATLFAMNSLELGTLVHSYMGSKMFFHYRCTRDGVYLILLIITWYMIGIVGALLWLGYVGISEQEIRASLKEIDGKYGQFVVFIMKHLQAEMTTQVESDVLLFCSIFYFTMGCSALLACICYMYVLIDCSVPECGHSLIKFFTGIWYVFVFGIILFPLCLARDGLRHLTFLIFYGADSWMGLLLLVCFSVAVSSSQGTARVVYDFYNVIHLKGYEVRTHFYPVPKIVVCLFTLFPLISLLRQVIEQSKPTEGTSDWSDPFTVAMGHFLLVLPLLAILFGAVYYFVKERTDKSIPVFQPHRDFYKNKHHLSICFKDYVFFDPEKIKPVGKKY